MNDQAQRIAIAEACGWKRSPQYDYSLYGIVGRGKAGFHCAACFEKDGLLHRAENLPDYLNDLNAMHEAIRDKIAGEEELETRFVEELHRIQTEVADSEDGPTICTQEMCDINAECWWLSLAFLRTIGKWEES